MSTPSPLFRLCLALVLAPAYLAAAKLELPIIFSDHLVLQREIRAPVWGRAAAGAAVRVQLAGEPALTTKADTAGRWQVEFVGLKARSRPATLVIASGTETITVRDVLVGEVWYAGGQSNMGTPVDQTTGAADETASPGDALLRMFTVGTSPARTPQFNPTGRTWAFKETSRWYLAQPPHTGKFAATAYYFAKELRAYLGDVPVAILHVAVGGRPIQSHCSPASLARTELGRRQLATWERDIVDWDSGRLQAGYPARLEAWRASGKGESDKPRPPVDPRTDAWQPTTLYNGMVHPHMPYGFRGAVWYQGENNVKASEEPRFYADTLANMIADWRGRFGHEFTWLIVQLAGFRSPVTVPEPEDPARVQWAWPFLQDQQRVAHERVARTGLVVAHDIGEENNIHPANKREVGRRLFRWARHFDYGGGVVPSGPLFARADFRGSEVVVSFKYAAGLRTRDGRAPGHFDLAGADGRPHWANARIDGDTVVVSSPSVPQPVQVRYAWASQPAAANLVNAEDLPASAFVATKDDPTGMGVVFTDRP